MASGYPYCWVWCCLRGDFAMLDRALEVGGVPREACYYSEVLGRWVLFHELPPEERAAILDPTLWDEIESRRWAGAPTRTDVGLGPRTLSPDVLAALLHQGLAHGHGHHHGRAWTRRRMPGQTGAA